MQKGLITKGSFCFEFFVQTVAKGVLSSCSNSSSRHAFSFLYYFDQLGKRPSIPMSDFCRNPVPTSIRPVTEFYNVRVGKP